MSRLRQRFYVSPLVLSNGHLRPVVDLYDAAWTWLADLGDRRLVQVFAKPQTVARLDRDRRLQALDGPVFAALQELTHRDGGADLLRKSLAQRPGLLDAAQHALSAAPPPRTFVPAARRTPDTMDRPNP
ncbi:MAG: hypothetical protein IT452_03950 [Planctomycetia bacterium]|nr:hypothetical protein [Planctomycetia bacterium]